jgi:hypothetical protein
LTLSQNSSHGLVAGSNSVVHDCVATGNSGDGLDLTSSCLVENNNCQANTLCGIHVLGNACRVEANHIGANGTSGLQVDGSQNLIVKNSAVNNVVTNYNIAANNDYGQIYPSPGAGFNNSNPWANFASVPAPTCTDGIKDGNETDVDCGGGTCPPCALGKMCNVGSDCASGSCTSGVCTSLMANGSACTSASQCGSGFCTGGVCCNTACNGACVACDRPGNLGTCGPAPAGTACSSASCSGNMLTVETSCDGAGNCASGAMLINCAPYLCSGTSCTISCPGNSPTGDAQCAVAYYCNGANCVSKLSTGAACTRNGQCNSGNCASGQCM